MSDIEQPLYETPQNNVRSNEQLYSPLPAGQYMRLLELAPGARNDPIVSRLLVVELKGCARV